MKKSELHKLIQQHIPQITHLETDSTEAAEGECRLWGSDDCTIMIDFADMKTDCHVLTLALQNIANKLAYLEEQRDSILKILSSENKDLEIGEVFVAYIAFWVENETEVFGDFVLTAASWDNRVAAFSLEEDNELIYNGIEAQ